MVPDIINIKQVLRRMRGRSQAFLVQGEDDRFYVAKFTGNPQGNRTLINEWIACRLFQQLGVSTPSLRVLRLTQRTMEIEPLCFHMSTNTVSVGGRFHLGSQCPVDPTTTAIYDFLPRRLLSKVVNLADLGSAFVIDTWLGQTDSRQAIFVRERANRSDLEFHLYLIDHGMSFAGRHWELQDSHLYCLYMDRSLYSILDMKAVCEETVSRIDTLTKNDLCIVTYDVPSSWFADGDHEACAKLLASVERRRNRLRSTISEHLETLEPEWRARSLQPIPR